MKWGMPMSFRGPITRGTILTSTVLGLRLVVQAGTLLIVARLLGPADFGAFAGITALAVVLGTLSTFGMQLVLMEEVSRDPAQRDQVLANALPVTLTLGTLLLVLFTTVSIAALGFPGLPFHAIIAIGAADIVVQPLLTFPAWRLTASGQPAASQLLLLFPLSLRLALAAIVFWAAPTDPLGVYGWAYLGASVIALCTVSTTRLSPWLAPRRWQWPGRTRWRKAAGYALVNMTAMAPSELDKTLAARLLPTADAGIYAAAQRTIAAITLPVSAMMLSALPRLYRDGRHDFRRTTHLVALVMSASALYGVALAALLWLAAPLFERLFGASYHGIGETVRWLCLAIPGMTLRITLANSLMATGTPWLRTGMEVVGLLALILASLALCATGGISGMAIAFTLSQWTMVAVGLLGLAIRARPGHSPGAP